MNVLSSLLLLSLPLAAPDPGPTAVEQEAAFEEEEAVDFEEEEVDFEEEEVDFGDDSEGAARVTPVRLPEVEYRAWLLVLPLALVGLLVWNVGWRRPAKRRPPKSAGPG